MASIREQIADQIVTVLGNISTANGYQTDVKAVSRRPLLDSDINGFPTLIVLFPLETKERRATNLYRCELRFTIGAWVDDNNDVPQQANAIIADIEKALITNQTLGGLVDTTEIETIEKYRAAPGSPHGFVIVEGYCEYFHERGNP